jgi:hypothetical protein
MYTKFATRAIVQIFRKQAVWDDFSVVMSLLKRRIQRIHILEFLSIRFCTFRASIFSIILDCFVPRNDGKSKTVRHCEERSNPE